jgi:hypothetical protein
MADSFKTLKPYNGNRAHVEHKNKSGDSNNLGAGTVSKSFRKHLSNIT